MAARDIQTKSGLTQLYNEKVIAVENVSRDMKVYGVKVPHYEHHGAKITTASGNQYLVHKGPDYGRASETVVTPASNMSRNWHPATKSDLGGDFVGVTRSVSGHTVGDFVRTGGTEYRFGRDDCRHAADRMMGLGNK